MDEECEQFLNSKNSVSGCYLAFAQFFGNFNLALLVRVGYKKSTYSSRNHDLIYVLITFLNWHLFTKVNKGVLIISSFLLHNTLAIFQMAH